jgi:A/G-specific adenine glycosylase
MAVLRDADQPVRRSRLEATWPDAEQRDRCLASLLADGLAEQVAPGRYQLPGHGPAGPPGLEP